jgi:hypothetical protein
LNAKPADNTVEPESNLNSNTGESNPQQKALSPEAEDSELEDLWDKAYKLLESDKHKKKVIEAYRSFLKNEEPSKDVLPQGMSAKYCPEFVFQIRYSAGQVAEAFQLRTCFVLKFSLLRILYNIVT